MAAEDMLCGLVDLGANSIRLSIYRVEDGNVKPLINKKETAGLSAYVENGVMARAGIVRACQVLSGFRGILDNFGIADLRVFATASLRNIENTEEAVSYIQRETGISVDVLSGEQEARLDFVGGSRIAGIREGLLIDIGGGSTELTEFHDGEVITAASMPVGSLNLYLRHVEDVLPMSKKSRHGIRREVLDELSRLPLSGRESYPLLYGVGGTIRATAKLANKTFGLPADNREISLEHLSELLHSFKESKKTALRQLLQASPERVHTLIPGMILLKTVAKRFDSSIILANSFGVREGYLYERVLGGIGGADAAGSAR